MKPETEAFLNLVRDAEDPNLEVQERVLAAVRGSLVLGAPASVVVPDASLPAAPGHAVVGLGKLTIRGKSLSGVFGSKLSVALVCAGAALGASDSPHPSPSATVALPRSASEPALAAVAASRAGARAPRERLPHAGGSVETSRELPNRPSVHVLRKRARSERNDSRPARSAARDVASGLAKPGAAPGTRRASGALERSSLQAELDLLGQVQAALRRGDGAEAFRRLEQHRTGDRQFLAERRALRILALCALGEVNAARQAAQGFAKQHPNSLQQRVVANSCANAQRIGRP